MAAELAKPIDSGFQAKSEPADVLAGIILTGKNAIVTGGYSGIGLETVRALAAAGMCMCLRAICACAQSTGGYSARRAGQRNGSGRFQIGFPLQTILPLPMTASTFRCQCWRYGVPRTAHRARMGMAVRCQSCRPFRAWTGAGGSDGKG